MSLSTVIVAVNSQTLKKYEPKGIDFVEKKHITIDPVCGMKVEPEKAHSKVEYEGNIIYFCSKECEEKFKKNPKKYMSRIKKEEPSKHEHHH